MIRRVRVGHCQLRLLLVCCALAVASRPTAGTLVTSIGYVFESFSPYAMIKFFEFSDKGWNISENCLRDMYNYLEGLKHGTLWAVKLYDATSYYAGGIFGSTNIRLHDPSLCRGLQQQFVQQEGYDADDFLSPNATGMPFAVHVIVGHYRLQIWDDNAYKYRKVQQLICLPQSCTNRDLYEILDVYLFQSNHIVRNNTYARHRIVNHAYNPFYDINFFVLIIFIFGSISLYTVVYLMRNCVSVAHENELKKETLRDGPVYIGELPALEHGKNVNFVIAAASLQNGNLPHVGTHRRVRMRTFEDFLSAISVHNVVYNLLQDSAVAAPPFFNVACTVLLIHSHLTAEILLTSNNFDFEREYEMGFIVKHASYLSDIYFFSCATKLAHQYFSTVPREKFNVYPQMLHILKLILQKLFCLTPSYTFSIFAEQILDMHLHNNIALEIPSFDYRNCKESKLSHILYADTYLPLAERCMPWTWFMSLEVQFFVVACLVLLLAGTHPRYAVIIGASIFVVSMLAATIWEYNARHRNTDHILSIEYELAEFNLVFDNICLRVCPYLMGLCLGFILQKYNSNIRLNIFVLTGGWIACIVMLVFCLCVEYDLLFVRVNQAAHMFLVALAHTLWSAVLMWTALTCLTQYGAFLNDLLCCQYLQTLEKLSSICLVIAPVVIRLLVFTTDAPIYTSSGQIFLMSIGCLLMTYLCALLLHVLLDGPVHALFDEVIIPAT